NKERHSWTLLEYGELYGKNLVVLGTGSLATAVAKIGQAFGMHVIGLQRQPGVVEHFDETYGIDDLDHTLERADAVVVTLPKTSSTIGLLDRRHVNRLPQHAYLVNIGRGEVVDEKELLYALQNESISGAYLDVFVDEPLPKESPLWDAPNLLITPHDAHQS